MNALPTARKYLAGILILCGLTMAAGCTGKSSQPSSPETGMEMPSIANMAGNFNDIELPVEMKWDTDDSMSISTSSFQGGILKYSGRVEIGSLKEFVIASMTNNKWKLVGEAQYENVLLAFTKPNKTCMVVLDESAGGIFGSTTATLYVTNDMAAGTRTNPFGESPNQMAPAIK